MSENSSSRLPSTIVVIIVLLILMLVGSALFFIYSTNSTQNTTSAPSLPQQITITPAPIENPSDLSHQLESVDIGSLDSDFESLTKTASEL